MASASRIDIDGQAASRFLVSQVILIDPAQHLPIIIGELGNLGEKASGGMVELRKAQAAAAASPRFRKGTVAFVKTTPFARPRELSPNPGHGHHWFGNAESYFLIGDALGRALLKLTVK
mgnify:CR=1 FL=1